MMNDIRLIIVDDHPAVRLGLEAILNKAGDIRVVGTAAGGAEALLLCADTSPDVALVDIFMPQMDGVETIKRIRERFPNVNCIVLSHAENNDIIVRALDAGASGYLLKNAEVADVAAAVRAAAAGKRSLSPEVLESLIRVRSTAPARSDDDALTERELEVLHYLAQGLTNPEIADRLVVALSTVKFHVRTIFRKLNVQTRTEAVVRALELRLTPSKGDGTRR